MMLDIWTSMERDLRKEYENIAEEIEDYRGGYWSVFLRQAGISLQMQFFILPFFVFWRVSGLMLLGMVLMRMGFFAARYSRGVYITTAILGYGLGFPLTYTGMTHMLATGFGMIPFMAGDGLWDHFGSVGVALGHISLVMLLCKSNLLPWLQQRLGAVGRTALSNYLAQSVIMALIFYGYGLGLYAHLERAALVPIIIAVWIVQLIVSPIWLKHFTMGPAEWLWRALTYKSRPPFRVASPSA
jgi:uncharacterized protein